MKYTPEQLSAAADFADAFQEQWNSVYIGFLAGLDFNNNHSTLGCIAREIPINVIYGPAKMFPPVKEQYDSSWNLLTKIKFALMHINHEASAFNVTNTILMFDSRTADAATVLISDEVLRLLETHKDDFYANYNENGVVIFGLIEWKNNLSSFSEKFAYTRHGKQPITDERNMP